MSLNIEMNKWTPKLIIVFQLTIWSVIGIILLQKGAISLCEKMKARNDTADVQEKLTRWNEKESVRESNVAESRLQIMKVHRIDNRQRDVVVDNIDDVTSTEQLPRKSHSFFHTGDIARGVSNQISTIKKRTTIRAINEHDTRDVRAIQTPTVYANNKNELVKIKHEENVVVAPASNENPYDTEKTMINNVTPNMLESNNSSTTNFGTSNGSKFFEHEQVNDIPYKTTENSKSETKPRRSPVNRIGAAIAIVMLAIGIVMLLLGPLIVIVRAFSNRRRTREMLLKSRNHNDRPPTYEEATLMDQAPRYSTLQLDTIHESSFSL